MGQRFDGKIDVQLRPIEMMRTGELDVQQLADRRVTKPGEIVERKEVFHLIDKQPESVLRNDGDFNW
jgi:hypothetical protein